LADELLKNGQDIPTPTGSVKLRFGYFGTVTQAVKRGGIAFALDWLPAGTHDLEVIYPGQGRFDSCRSGLWSLEVRVLIDTETHLFVNGTSATVTVTAADSSTPTGQALLSYPHGGAPTPTLYQDLVNGSATFDLSFFPPGKHAVQAAYCKQRGHYYPSTSNVETVTVRRPRGR